MTAEQKDALFDACERFARNEKELRRLRRFVEFAGTATEEQDPGDLLLCKKCGTYFREEDGMACPSDGCMHRG